MAMISIAHLKRTMARRHDSILEKLIASIAVTLGIILNHTADCLLPQRAIDLGKHALAGFLQGWYAGKATNDCIVCSGIQARTACCELIKR